MESSFARPSSPYRDETAGMTAHCARLEEEIRMLRRSIRVLSEKHASFGELYVRRVRPRRPASYFAKLVAVFATALLTCAGWSVGKRTMGCRAPLPPTELRTVVLASAGVW
jgi:hypothetical protein